MVQALVKCGEILVLGPGQPQDPEGSLKNHVNEDVQTYIKVVGLIDIKLEIDRLKKRQAEIKKYMDDLSKKMSFPGYEAKVPEAVRAENTRKMNGYEAEYNETVKSQGVLAQFL